jgi:hypothetical protein
MADVTSTLTSWSSTAASNLPANSAAVGPNTLADNQRVIQAVVRAALAGDGTIASATTTDLSTVNDGDITVTGTTTITGLGTLTAGIKKVLTFSGVLTLTHNATSLILPGAANITTAAGDVAIMRSLGSGNWKCIAFQPAAGNAKVGANADITSMTALTAPTVAANPVRAADLQKQVATRFSAGGTADTITGTLSPAPASLTTGTRVSTTPPGANTVTSPTLNVNALGAKKIFKKNSSGSAVALAVGDYNASGPFDFEYNTALDAAAGGWVLLNSSSSVQTASTTGTALTNATSTNVTSISLPAGKWVVQGNVVYTTSATTNVTRLSEGMSTLSGSQGVVSNISAHVFPGGSVINSPANGTVQRTTPSVVFNLPAPATIYLVALPYFSVSTLTADGYLSAFSI